jgi:tight adherence protein B
MRCPERLRRRVLLVGPFLGCLLLGGPAWAADGAGIDIDHVETTDGRTSVLIGVDRLPSGTVVDPGHVSVEVDGSPVTAQVDTVKGGVVQRTTVLALDVSNSMRGQIDEARQAALAFIRTAPADLRIGLVTFSADVHDTIAPTTDRAALEAAVRDIELSTGTRVYDAVAAAANLSGESGARSVLVLSDGRDQGGGLSLDDVAEQVADSGVVVDAVALGSGAESPADLARVADASGGAVVTADPASLRAVFAAEAAALAGQLVATFTPPEGTSGDVDLDVSLTDGDQAWTDSAVVRVERHSEESAAGVSSPRPAAPLVGRTIMLIGLAAVGAALLLTVLALLKPRGRPGGHRRIATFLGEMPASSGPDIRGAVVATAARMVGSTRQQRLAQRLAGAGMSLTAPEWVLVHAGIVVAAAVVGVVVGGVPLMVVLMLLGALGPVLFLRIKHARRLRAFSSQLPDTLGMVANSLTAGLSPSQSVDTVVREGLQPISGELRRALMEQQLGSGLEDALDGVAQRMGSEDFSWVVMAMRIQREVGGNLAEVLTTVAETLREREMLRRQVLTLSAEGRLSAWILGGLPIGLFLYMMLANRDYVRPLYTEFFGMVLLGIAVLLLSTGAFLMSRLVKVVV